MKRLYDLVKVRDEALRCAFYYALRDSLVAENLEQASRIALQRQQALGRGSSPCRQTLMDSSHGRECRRFKCGLLFSCACTQRSGT